MVVLYLLRKPSTDYTVESVIFLLLFESAMKQCMLAIGTVVSIRIHLAHQNSSQSSLSLVKQHPHPSQRIAFMK